MKQILLVEPDKAIAGIVAEYLERGGECGVTSASSAQEAIHVADSTKPDLVILELAMPSHNGFEFLHEFRSYVDWSNIPVIVHTHLPRNDSGAEKIWRLLGVSRYLYKPRTSLRDLKIYALEELAVYEARY